MCFLFNSASRALAFWLELVCVLYMMIVITIFFVLEDGTYISMDKCHDYGKIINFLFLEYIVSDIIGAHVGLAITQILSLITNIQWGMRQTAELG